jgi:ubiquinone/menaquinone biosynthesis C-methylase UbiE
VDHADHVALIRDGIAGPEDGAWADLGSGTGAFTLALADLLGPAGTIVSVDRDAGALREQERRMRARFPGARVTYLRADFEEALALPPLDGLLMANALHFVRREDQAALVRRLAGHLRPGGRFVLVEYDAERGNPWVPHPVSWRRWQRLATDVGLEDVRPIGRVSSRFLGAIHSALGVKGGG